MRVEVIPPIRIQHELAALGRTYLGALVQLVGSETAVKSLHTEWAQTGKPATHLYNEICERAHKVAVQSLLPSERGLVSFIHTYD